MYSNPSGQILLSVVTPLSKMAGRLQRLEEWLSGIGNGPIQVILIHDRQDEATGPEIQTLVAELRNPRIQLIEEFFGCPGLARNRGIELAQGKWICFWDSDDSPSLKEAVSLIESKSESKADCLITNFNSVNEISKEVTTHRLGTNFDEEFGLNPGLWRIFFKYSAISGLRFGPLRMAEDQIFLSEFFSTHKEMEILSDITYTYYFGESSHLTKNSMALNDLGPATIESLRILRRLDSQRSNLIAIMFVKLVFSGLKFGGLRTKGLVVIQYLKSLLITSMTVRKSVLSSSLRIVLAKVR